MTYELHQGDCLEVMAGLEAGSVDAVICDPPYGTTAHNWDKVLPFASVWQLIERVLRPKGVVVFFGSEPFSSLLRVSKFDWYKYDWVWEKTMPSNFLNAKNMPLRNHENIMVFSPGVIAHKGKTNNRMRFYPQMREGKPYIRTRSMSRLTWGNMKRPSTAEIVRHYDGQRYPTSVLHFSNPNHNNIHPTQKPVDLLAYLIQTYTSPGDTVLDFTMGSGSTVVAALQCDRNAIGIELERTYFDLASERIRLASQSAHSLARPAHDSAADLPLFAGIHP